MKNIKINKATDFLSGFFPCFECSFFSLFYSKIQFFHKLTFRQIKRKDKTVQPYFLSFPKTVPLIN